MHFLRLLTAAAIGSASFSPSAATASEVATQALWDSSERDDRCIIYSRPSPESYFAFHLERTGVFSYRIQTVSAGKAPEDRQPPAIEVRKQKFLLDEAHNFPSLVEDASEFTVSGGNGEPQTFSLTGFNVARAKFDECAKKVALQGEGPPRLIEFTGIHQLTAVANRQRMLGEILRYELDVAADGKVNDCRLSRKFRRKYVTISFCRVLMEHHKFAPARNAEGEAVAGTYTGAVHLIMPIKAG